MKHGLTFLLTILLLACRPTIDKVNAVRHKVIFLPDNSFKSEQDTIKKIINVTLLECNKYLKNDSLTFNVLPTTADDKEIIKEMRGAMGITYDNKHISITIDPTVIFWKETLKYTIAHEYNHAYCMTDTFLNTYKWTLLNYLVFEGKADYFAHSLYPKVIVPWTSALSEKEKSTLWTQIKPDLLRADTTFNAEVMFGSKTYPIWGGYTLGFNIVQSALRNNSNLTVKAWTNLAPDKILEMSDYKLGAH